MLRPQEVPVCSSLRSTLLSKEFRMTDYGIHLGYSLKPLNGLAQGIIQGSIMRVTESDTSSLDYSSFRILYHAYPNGPCGLLRYS